jgi:hypothetical protein
MGVRILEDRESNEAVLYCSTSGWAFGPLFGSRGEAEKFLETLAVDPRKLTDLELRDRYSEFIDGYVCECGSVLGVDYEDEAPVEGERFVCPYCREKQAKVSK